MCCADKLNVHISVIETFMVYETTESYEGDTADIYMYGTTQSYEGDTCFLIKLVLLFGSISVIF